MLPSTTEPLNQTGPWLATGPGGLAKGYLNSGPDTQATSDLRTPAIIGVTRCST